MQSSVRWAGEGWDRGGPAFHLTAGRSSSVLFVPGGRGDRTHRRPLHHDQLVWVVPRFVVDQQLLDGTLLDLDGQEERGRGRMSRVSCRDEDGCVRNPGTTMKDRFGFAEGLRN